MSTDTGADGDPLRPAVKRTVQGWLLQPGVLAESYEYEPALAVEIPRHVHETYQFGLAPDHGGQYVYRGSQLTVPVGQLVIVHPGEPHSTFDRDPPPHAVRYWMMYVDPRHFEEVVREPGERRAPNPFFPEVTYGDRELVRTFGSLFDPGLEALDRDERLFLLLSRLATRHAQDRRPPRRTGAAGARLHLVRDYLHEHFAQETTLAELAELADLSRFHLIRSFVREFGVTPHAYQRMVRIDRAKTLIGRGVTLARVAIETGFFDQSHLDRHFRRLVGVSPGRYASRPA